MSFVKWRSFCLDLNVLIDEEISLHFDGLVQNYLIFIRIPMEIP